MTNMGPMYFYTGIPNSKTATLPSYPRKGKVPADKMEKPKVATKRFLWGGYTVEIKDNIDATDKD